MTDDLDKTIPPQRPAGNDFDVDKTIPPQRSAGNDYLRQMETEEAQTMAPRRERKTDGRFAVGDLIMGRYKVLAELGQGGMGVVYKCFDETAGIEVALKALPPELSHNSLEMDDIKDNFQLVHNLHHPNIASSNTLERNPENGNYYLIMECCEGEDLRRWIKRKRKDNPLTLNDVLPVIQQVADALDYAHAQKIMHRDIKPGNIMIDGAGSVKVLDFGLAAQIHTSMTRVSMAYHGTSGTGPYMAPEQWEGRVQDAKADQYALAVMTYEMLAGHLPFESADPAVLREAVLKSKAAPLDNIPESAQKALDRAMSKDLANRFNSCADFAAALGGAKVAKSKKVSSGKSGGAWKWIAAVIVLALLAGGAFGGWYFAGGTEAEAEARKAADAEARRIAAEQKAAEEKAREKNLDKMHAALLSKLKPLKEKIQSNSWHTWGQNFDKQWSELQSQETTAENSTRFDNKVEALEKAVAAAVWIVNNAPKREEARKLIEEENAHKSAADQYEPMTFAKDLYTAAGANMTEGKDAYEKGDFETALAKLKAGLDGYAKAKVEAQKNKTEAFLKVARENADKDWQKVADYATKAGQVDESNADAKTLLAQAKEKQNEISGLLKQANAARNANWSAVLTHAKKVLALESGNAKAKELIVEAKQKQGEVAQALAEAKAAKERKNWETALAKVNAVLEIESGNQAALALKNEAETHLVPTLKFQFTCNGEAFSKTPVVTALKTKPQKNGTLERGKEYEFSFLYREGSFFYRGKTAFTCDWFGPKQIKVALTKLDYAGEAEWLGLKLSADKKTVTGVKSKDITSCVIPYGITSIGEEAFRGCTSLTSITIPDSVTSIGENAFRGCTSLTSITIPDSVTSIGGLAFSDCKNLTGITIPDSVTSIGKYAFSDCKNLTGITIGNSVTSIEAMAFSHCTSLESITIPDSVTSIGWQTFEGCTSLESITIPDSVTSIGENAFWGCSSLTSITIPDSVASIGARAFRGCTSLESITIPDSVTGIGKGAFDEVETVTYSPAFENLPDGALINKKHKALVCAPKNVAGHYTIPDSVTSIGEYAFEYCEKLTSITIPDSVTSIGKWAFCGCRNLTSITIPDSVTSIGEYAFYGCDELTSITLPDSVTSIGQQAFFGCDKLTSITLPDSVTSIGQQAFLACKNLTSITIPDSVASIGEYAFCHCENLTSITIPDSVMSIGKRAFYDCENLTSITIPRHFTDKDVKRWDVPSRCKIIRK